MKRKIFIFFIILSAAADSFLMFNCFAWEWINPVPNNKTIEKIQFLNSNTGFSIIFNTIYKTTNEGNNWFRLNEGMRFCSSFGFLNENFGYAISDSGFGVTTNGGLNWVYNMRNVGSFHVTSGYMTNMNDAYATVTIYSPFGPFSHIFCSTNQGNNWFNPNYNECDHFGSFFFVSENIGYLTGKDGDSIYLYSSTNPKVGWSRTYIPYSCSWTGTVFARTQQDIYIKLDNDFIRSSNSGANWVNDASLYSMSYLKFINSITGYATGGTIVKKTTNGGNNWFIQSSPEDYNYNSVSSISDNDILISGNYGCILKTSNGGNNWNTNAKYFSVNNLNDLKIIGKDTIIIAGDTGKVYTSYNGGTNWNSIQAPTRNNLMRLLFINNSTGFAVGDSTTILKTTDCGNNWDVKKTGVYGFLKDISPVNNNVLFATGFYNISLSYVPILLKSTDSGNTWFDYPPPINDILLSVRFINAQTGFLGSFAPHIFKTTDGGNNWVEKSMQDYGSGIKDIYFIDGGTGFISTSESYIHKTTDFGETWSYYSYMYTRGLNRFAFINSSTGFLAAGGGSIVGDIGCLYYTTNTGINWYKNTLNFAGVEKIYTVAFSDENTGYVCGQNGLLMKTINGGIVFSEKKYTTIPEYFTLEQNFPNPFNAVTRIKFTISQSNIVTLSPHHFVTLKIYDLLGREIAILLNDNLQPGIYEVSFDAGNLPSGIYFYRLSTTDFSETKKIILIK